MGGRRDQGRPARAGEEARREESHSQETRCEDTPALTIASPRKNLIACDELLGQGEACGHDFVMGELLVGDQGGRTQLLSDFALMHQVPVVPHRDVVEFVRHRRLYGRGIGWIDTHLLASALVSHVQLWTADPRLGDVARELRIDYE